MSPPSRRNQWIHPFLCAAALFFLGGGGSFAADPARAIPVARDRGGSEVTVEITQPGSRQSATPTASLAEPTLDRIAGQIKRRTGVDLRQGDSLDETSRHEEVPGKEITARDAKTLLKTLRGVIRNKGAPAATPASNADSSPPAPANIPEGWHAIAEESSTSRTGRN
jgi:hypothetical protein